MGWRHFALVCARLLGSILRVHASSGRAIWPEIAPHLRWRMRRQLLQRQAYASTQRWIGLQCCQGGTTRLSAAPVTRAPV